MEQLVSRWTPLHHRIISHRIGDGTLNSYSHVAWDNKHIIGFYLLCMHLGIKLWNPVKSDSYGTMKIIIPDYLFKSYAAIFKKNYEKLKADKLYLLNAVLELPEDFRVQTILALIVDDGCCKNWLLVVFEDSDKVVVEKARELWESIFPGTSKISYITTKAGKLVYHLYANRYGIIALHEKLQRIKEVYGELSGLWWKDEDLLKRYLKAVSQRGKLLEERRRMRATWEKVVIDLARDNGSVTMKDIRKKLGISMDRTLLVVDDLRRIKRLKLVGRTYHAKYILANNRILSSDAKL